MLPLRRRHYPRANASEGVRVTQLSGKIALVTGGAGGIGLAIARALIGQGATSIVADVDAARGEAAAERAGGRFLRLDVGDPADWEQAIADIRAREGSLDIAVLNAGLTTGAPTFEDLSSEQYRRIMRVNVDGVVLGAQSVLPLLSGRERSWIVATASLAGLTPMPADPVYAATKHAVIGFVRSLAVHAADQGVKVQALCPGIADTAIVTPEERDRMSAAGLPLIDVDHVARTALAALASEGTGEAWVAQLGLEPMAYGFRGVPGARMADGSVAAPPAGWGPGET
jgi:NAD(P)-dependent dehydrogenase (short-subunit alcohol dehydrogenase family)